MRKTVLLFAALLVVCASAATAQSWYWANGGGIDPATVQATDLTTPYTWGGGSATPPYWSSVTGNSGAGDTALQVISQGSSGKCVWNKSGTFAATTGFTLAFSVKATSLAASSNTMLSFCTGEATGMTTYMKVPFKLLTSGGKICIQDSDNTGATSQNVQDAYLPLWVTGSWNGSADASHYTIKVWFWDNTNSVWNYWQTYGKNSSSASSNYFGYNDGTNACTYNLDYLAFTTDGAFVPGTSDSGSNGNRIGYQSQNSGLQFPATVPEPGSFAALGLGLLSLVGAIRRRSR